MNMMMKKRKNTEKRNMVMRKKRMRMTTKRMQMESLERDRRIVRTREAKEAQTKDNQDESNLYPYITN